MPTVWGSLAHSSKALPPLKSTSTNVRWSGSTLAASPATSVRSSSDLPAPVVPPTRPWGPSATKSTENTPSSDTPIGRGGAGIDAARLPPGQHGLGRALLEVEQRQQPDRRRQPGAHQVELGILEPGQRPGAVAGHVVGHARRRRKPPMRSPCWGRVEVGAAVGVGHLDHGGAHRGQPVDGRGDDDAGHQPAVAAEQARGSAPCGPRSATRRRPPRAASGRPARSGGDRAPLAARPAGLEPGLDHAGRQLGVVRQHAPEPAGVAGVGQPLGPVPRRPAPSAPARTMTGRSAGPCSAAAWHTQRAGQGQGGSAVADDADHPAAPPGRRAPGAPRQALATRPAPRPALPVRPRRARTAATGADHGTSPDAGAQPQEVAGAPAGAPTALVLGSSTRRMISAGSG